MRAVIQGPLSFAWWIREMCGAAEERGSRFLTVESMERLGAGSAEARISKHDISIGSMR